MTKTLNEREKFDEWWQSTGQIVGQLTAWEAWKARALLDDPTCLDCEECEGTGDGDTSGDPQNTFPCPVCKGERVAPWA